MQQMEPQGSERDLSPSRLPPGDLIWLLLRERVEQKRLSGSAWPAWAGGTGLFLCGLEGCEGVSALFGGGRMASVCSPSAVETQQQIHAASLNIDTDHV